MATVTYLDNFEIFDTFSIVTLEMLLTISTKVGPIEDFSFKAKSLIKIHDLLATTIPCKYDSHDIS
jgi:hypothetical protein